MTDQHPLTDEIILSIADEAYHLPGYQDDMRAAADWQLEQVIQAWEQCLEWPKTDIQNLLDFGQKLKAMRPTTTTETP